MATPILSLTVIPYTEFELTTSASRGIRCKDAVNTLLKLVIKLSGSIDSRLTDLRQQALHALITEILVHSRSRPARTADS
jgi:hypothetical protein